MAARGKASIKIAPDNISGTWSNGCARQTIYKDRTPQISTARQTVLYAFPIIFG